MKEVRGGKLQMTCARSEERSLQMGLSRIASDVSDGTPLSGNNCDTEVSWLLAKAMDVRLWKRASRPRSRMMESTATNWKCTVLTVDWYSGFSKASKPRP